MTEFIKRVQSSARNYLGKELSPEEMATEFAKWDKDTRVSALKELEASASENMTTRQFSEHMAYSRALIGTHERLRKADR
jgi:hypothetical protein